MSRKTSKFRKMFRIKSRNKSQINRLRPLAGLLAAGLSLPGLAAAQSKEFPTYVTGPQPNGSWVVSDGAVITPAGTQVDLGIRVRAKAIALNPIVRSSHRGRPHLGRDRRPSRSSTPTPAMSCRTTPRSDRMRKAAIAA